MKPLKQFFFSLATVAGSLILLEFGLGVLIGVIGPASDAYAKGAPFLTVIAAFAIPVAIMAAGIYFARLTLARFIRAIISWRKEVAN